MPVGTARTCMNGLNALSGVGLLTVPYALSEGGWVSLALLAAVAAACWYTGILLCRCMDADDTIRTYPDIGERAFGRTGRLLVSAFTYAELYLVATGFLILEGDNLDKLFPGASVTLGTVSLAGKRLFVVLAALVVAPTTWLRSLGVLAYVSATGVFASVAIVLSVLWAAAVDGVGFSGRGTTTPLRIAGLPTALGLYIFCYAGHPMLVICFLLCTLNYGAMAVLGYLMYGDGVLSQVTLNLPSARLSSKVAIYTTLLNPVTKYALVVTPIAAAVEERIRGAAGKGAAAVSVAVRTLLVLSTVAVALALPFFADLMALVGSMLNVAVCMLLPCACYVRIFGAPSMSSVEAVAIGGILVLGSLVAVTGTCYSLMNIIHELRPDFEQPLLQAHAAVPARGKQEPAERDHEAQCSPEADGDGATFVRTCFNGLNALSGEHKKHSIFGRRRCVGLLSIPYALSEGGWLSLVLLLAVAMVCCYTGLLLRRCMAASPAVRGYPDIGALAFGAKGRLAVSAFLYAELYLVAIGFLILEGDNLDKLFPGTSLTFGGLVVSGKQLFVVVVAVVILPTTWLRSLAVLAYVSASGVLASVVVVFCVLWAAVFDGVGYHGKGRMLNVSGLPTALGLYTFCYCGHAIFPTLCNSMQEKDKFSRVLVICFVACTVNYGSMAILGYLMYGDDVKSQVTLNLPEGKISSKLAIYTTLINPFSKYALMVTPVATAIEEKLLAGNKRSVNVLIRTLIVVSTVVIALTVPFFGHLMALVGSLLSVMASMLLPCICYLKIFGLTRCGRGETLLIAAIIVLGSLVAATGTYSSLKKIFYEF
uniref:Amino acid transporter transmembrane domain-containing protein n=1 Tax=Oryza meridionalis TaxID=40149 RepID=A0A0E0DF34_9ORYZ